LLTFRNYAQQVPFIYFVSTPQTGAQMANLASVFSSDPLLRALIPGDGNDYLQNLENEWRAAQFHIHRFCAYEKKKYKGVLVVDRLSGTRNCDDPPLAINEDQRLASFGLAGHVYFKRRKDEFCALLVGGNSIRRSSPENWSVGTWARCQVLKPKLEF
jgi:hypothetical protein